MATTKSTTKKTTKTTTSPKTNQSSEKAVAEVVENTIKNTNEDARVEESPIVSYKAKKAIPMDAMVMVRSAVNGTLIYVSKRTNGYTETWSALGEEIPMEMAELYSMKNTDRAFFTENWIEVDPVVLRDLQMERFYENSVSVADLDKVFEMTGDELRNAIRRMKENTKNAFALEAMRRVENGELDNFRTISVIEEELKCELYEH